MFHAFTIIPCRIQKWLKPLQTKYFKMRITLIVLLLFVANSSIAQKNKKVKLDLKNVVVIGQMASTTDNAVLVVYK